MYDCIIIGSGPAGMSASIYLKNANKKVLIIEKNTPGGNILKANKINNYLGINDQDSGKMAYSMYEQVNNMDIPIAIEKVLKIENNEEEISVITDKQTYKSKYIILTCGRCERSLNLVSESKLIGKGVSYCAKCDGSLFKNKIVAVVGGQDDSISETKYLSNIAQKVYYFNYSKNNVKINKDNIKIIDDLKIISLEEDNGVLSEIKLEDGSSIKVDGLFILNGYTPNTKFIDNLNIKTEKDYIVVDNHMRTNIENIYAAGDIIKKDLYQIITAAAEGAIAATDIIKKLN